MDNSRSFLIFFSISIAAVIIGWLIGNTLGFQERQLVFPIAVVLGVGWFISFQYFRRTPRPPQQKILQLTEPNSEKTAQTSSIEPKLSEKEILSPEESRQWLDDFLVKQQQVKK
jgi:hypothetical protein